MADPQALGHQFVTFYYETFDSNRDGLATLYRDHSLLSFEGSTVQGGPAIIERLTTLPFSRIAHRIDSLDVQPARDGNSLHVLVTGALLVDQEQRPMNYVQYFQLSSDSPGSYFVQHDVFRLVYPASN